MKGIIGHIEFKDKILYQDKGLGCLVIQDVNYKTQLSLSMKSTLYGYGAGEFASCAGEIVYVNDGGLWRDGRCIAKGIFGDLVSGDHCVWGILVKDQICQLFQYKVKTNQLVFSQRPAWLLASNIVLHPKNQNKIAFIEWDRRLMPWDQSHVVIWDGEQTLLKNPYGENIQQVAWVDADTLVMIAQVGNWWNLVLYHFQDNLWRILITRPYDCLVPLWGRGQRTMGVFERKVTFCEQQDGQHLLYTFDIDQETLMPVSCPFTHVQELRVASNGQLLVKGGDPWHDMALWSDKDHFITSYDRLMPYFNLRKIGDDVIAWLYEVKDHHAIVISSHGGPAGQHALVGDAGVAKLLNHKISFCALDYRGSTGRGAEFRNCIYGKWGQVDVDDCVNLIGLIQSIFPKLPIFLKGNSAGAMTCLLAAARVRVDGVFMRYPVLNISALLEHNSLFEGNYLSRLLPAEVLALDLVDSAIKCECPFLIQQGDEDEIVHAAQVEIVVRKIMEKGGQVQYVLHRGEGHGFRSPTVSDCAQSHELAFIHQWSQKACRHTTE